MRKSCDKVVECRANQANVVLEKGHGAGKKAMALEKKGMAQHHAKTGYRKHYGLQGWKS